MHCTSSTITTAIVGFLAATSAVLAAPAPRPQDTNNNDANPTPVAASAEDVNAPAAAAAPAPAQTTTSPTAYYGPLTTIYPSYTSTYHVNNGAVDFHVSQAVVSKSPRNGGADTTALVTFVVSEYYKDRSCQLVFDLTSYGASAYGTKKAQLFTSLAPATQSATTWPSGNLRNNYLGTVDVVVGARATWEAGSGPGASKQGFFPCAEIAGKVYGGEVVPQGDEDYISWVAGADGPKIVVW